MIIKVESEERGGMRKQDRKKEREACIEPEDIDQL